MAPPPWSIFDLKEQTLSPLGPSQTQKNQGEGLEQDSSTNSDNSVFTEFLIVFLLLIVAAMPSTVIAKLYHMIYIIVIVILEDSRILSHTMVPQTLTGRMGSNDCGSRDLLFRSRINITGAPGRLAGTDFALQ